MATYGWFLGCAYGMFALAIAIELIGVRRRLRVAREHLRATADTSFETSMMRMR
jgi:hypothetical protein